MIDFSFDDAIQSPSSPSMGLLNRSTEGMLSENYDQNVGLPQLGVIVEPEHLIGKGSFSGMCLCLKNILSASVFMS